MENCLENILKGLVDNDNLQILGEMRIKNNVVANPIVDTQKIVFHNQGNDVSLKIINNDDGNTHHFTDSALTGDLGTELTSPSNRTYYEVLVTPGSIISVISKYSLKQLIEIAPDAVRYNAWSYSLDDLEYADITTSLLVTESVYGNINSLKGKQINNLYYPALNVGEYFHFTGGSIVDLINEIKPANVYETNRSYAGEYNNTKINVSDINNDRLILFSAPNGTIIEGDLSQITGNVNFLYLYNFHIVNSWTARATNKQIMVVRNVDFGDDLATYLKNISNCDHSGPLPLDHQIDIRGTYDTTDAELATAIANLKSYGYLIRINGSPV